MSEIYIVLSDTEPIGVASDRYSADIIAAECIDDGIEARVIDYDRSYLDPTIWLAWTVLVDGRVIVEASSYPAVAAGYLRSATYGIEALYHRICVQCYDIETIERRAIA